jgi:MoxR-like ATPase
MNMKKLLKAAWFTPGAKGRWGLPLLIEGPPGTGKTSTIEPAAESCGLPHNTLLASLREPADFMGIPIPQGQDEVLGVARCEYAPPAWAVEAYKRKHGVVFFDEINTAPPAVQASLLRVILEGVVGELTLPAHIRFVAAMNATEQAAGGWDLAPPLANRFGHIKWSSPDAEGWADWLLGAGTAASAGDVLDPVQEEKRVMAAWPEPFARAQGLIAGFVRTRPDFLFKMPEVGSPNASKAWPSPRTWEMATRALAGAEVHGLTAEETESLMAAFVGEGPVSEFMTWREEQDLPNPAHVLDGKVKFKHDPQRLDRTMAVLGSCSALVEKPDADKREARVDVLWGLIGEVAKDAMDITVPGAKVLCRADLHKGTHKKAATPVLAKMMAALDAAGIKP